ncbi:MAG: EVE domain-containing protein [Gammaproteobacteria bacterium]|jgi:predicted RNA-binding protein with PUA-like domain
MNYWLMKSEPDVFGIDDLRARPQRTEHWDGVRNYQVRNMLRDQMKQGDQAFFYHSSCKEPGIVGIVDIMREGYPDDSAWNPDSPYYDPKSAPARPRWYMVDVRYRRKLRRCITLQELKRHPALDSMPLLRPGTRLSITPVNPAHWHFILELE